jgi:hypothetical protein
VSGLLTFTHNSQELNIGTIPLPSAQTNWADVDQQLAVLLTDYTRRIDPENKLGLPVSEASIIGYQMSDGSIRDCLVGKVPSQHPSELITPTTTIRLRLRGAAQDSADSLVLESLFPREILHKLLHLLLSSRRLVINGPTGIGKSKLSRYLARYLAARKGFNADRIKDIMFPNDETDSRFIQVQQDLETHLKSDEESIILIDNTPRRRLDLICEAFASADEYYAANNMSSSQGPFVIITLNRTSDLQLTELQVQHNVHAFSLYCQLEPIKGEYQYG